MELPLGDPYAPTILIVGDTAGAMARACSLTFPTELCLTVSYRTRRKNEHGLYWCGDACDILWRQRWRLVIAHPDRMRTAPRDATRQARIASGELWWSMARTVMLYCAPAETVVIECPCPELALTWRAPDTTMRLADYGVNSPLSWCLWQRGGVTQATAQTPHANHTATRAAQTPPSRGAGDGGRAPRRHETPPEIADAICASIDLQSGAPREQPLYHEMVETLAESYRRHAGSEPPDGYAEPTAQPLHPSQRRAPRAPAGAGSAANLETHFLAGLPLRHGTHAAEERARRATPKRRADTQTSGATEQHGGHGTHRAPPHGATHRRATRAARTAQRAAPEKPFDACPVEPRLRRGEASGKTPHGSPPPARERAPPPSRRDGHAGMMASTPTPPLRTPHVPRPRPRRPRPPRATASATR